MPEALEPPLSNNQKSMLDLALACHLKVAPVTEQDAIRLRHKNIKTRKDASQYITEVETLIHSRRKFRERMPASRLAPRLAERPASSDRA
jgi:hypothetical protein